MVRFVNTFAASIALATLLPSLAVAIPVHQERDLVNRDAHEPVFEGYLRELYADEDEVASRHNSGELADVEARNPEPFFALFKLAAKGIGAAVNAIKNRKRKRDLGDDASEELELISRADVDDLADLMSRNPEPFLPLLGLGLGLLGSRKRDFALGDSEEIFERYFDEIDHQVRDMDGLEDLDIREIFDAVDIADRHLEELD